MKGLKKYFYIILILILILILIFSNNLKYIKIFYLNIGDYQSILLDELTFGLMSKIFPVCPIPDH
jgi:hypothetical protein